MRVANRVARGLPGAERWRADDQLRDIQRKQRQIDLRMYLKDSQVPLSFPVNIIYAMQRTFAPNLTGSSLKLRH